ncbi:hypothetical protein CAC42_1452 [Sphaceloma murrayae]|uniref:Uncharacterized protein n=1 Tax=Sphaceloma murrayae TaxID=2082308 RepID=A0A2K1QY84_9PEZI|nr:hypothetical protein CAC42_1452 [Sphaceloma murrayae]
MRSRSLLPGFLLLSSSAAQLREIFQAPNGVFLENLAVRPNGDILFNGGGSPSTFLLSFADGRETISILPAVPNVTSLFGIAEVNHDLFLVAGGQGNPDGSTTPGSLVTYAYNFNTSPVTISLVAPVPSALLLNGAAALPPRRRDQNATVLFSDTLSGQIFHVDPTTGQVASIFRDEAASSVPPPPFVRPGVNGYKYVPRLKRLFFANSGSILGVTSDPEFGSVRLEIEVPRRGGGGLPRVTTGGEAVEILAPGLAVDDFAVRTWRRRRREGRETVVAAANSRNQLVEIGRSGVRVLVGNETDADFVSPSAVAFGRRREDRNKVYVTALGDFVSGGRLWEVVMPGPEGEE